MSSNYKEMLQLLQLVNHNKSGSLASSISSTHPDSKSYLQGMNKTPLANSLRLSRHLQATPGSAHEFGSLLSLQSLPTHLLHLIACELSDVKDLMSFTSCSRAIHIQMRHCHMLWAAWLNQHATIKTYDEVKSYCSNCSEWPSVVGMLQRQIGDIQKLWLADAAATQSCTCSQISGDAQQTHSSANSQARHIGSCMNGKIYKRWFCKQNDHQRSVNSSSSKESDQACVLFGEQHSTSYQVHQASACRARDAQKSQQQTNMYEPGPRRSIQSGSLGLLTAMTNHAAQTEDLHLLGWLLGVPTDAVGSSCMNSAAEQSLSDQGDLKRCMEDGKSGSCRNGKFSEDALPPTSHRTSPSIGSITLAVQPSVGYINRMQEARCRAEIARRKVCARLVCTCRLKNIKSERHMMFTFRSQEFMGTDQADQHGQQGTCLVHGSCNAEHKSVSQTCMCTVERLVQQRLEHVLNEAIMTAAVHVKLNSMRYLLESGADVNANNGRVLRWCCRAGSVAMVQLLLDYGADVHSMFGACFQHAQESGSRKILQLLHAAAA